MKDTPVNARVVSEVLEEVGIRPAGRASIRELVRIVNLIEERTGDRFVRMEMGVPGLMPPSVGVEAEIAALKNGVASKYPNIEGVASLKEEASRFIKLFLDIDLRKEGCIPTVGSMMGGMAVFMVANRSDAARRGTLFLDPGFPVQKQQCRILGHEYGTFDVYDYRGEKLREKLDRELSEGRYSSMIYSNPNNPSWICFTEEELQIIGEMANKYDVTVIEDLAYFGMDFRKDYSRPGEPPFQPTVARYTDNYVLLISSSKVFSYAGQRIGILAISDKLFGRQYPGLKRYFSSDKFGYALIFGALYALSAGASHAPQYGLAAMLKEVNDGKYDFLNSVKEYGEKAAIMKKIFTDNGFRIVYDYDLGEPIADGFYFTIAYPGMSGVELVEELLYYGVSAISLDITGSTRSEGLRACVSLVDRAQFPDLEQRLARFRSDHPVK
ncbi:MAG: aminotransferase class I/II-fold pyridoxal phosphate-dependent enzyme [Bacteroidota bacterium]